VNTASSIKLLEQLARLAGAIGYASFVATLLLILRLPILERLFSGLPRVYRLHHLLGALTFIVLLVHPVLLSAALSFVSARAGARILTNLRDPIVLLGWVSLLFLMLVMLTTFAFRLKYEVWRFTHVASALVFVSATVHALLALKDTPARFRIAVGGAAIGAGALLHWEVIARAFRARHAYLVREVRRLSPELLEIRLRPTAAPLRFTPGQFVYVSFHDDPQGTHRCGVPRESHPFSLASAPSEKELRLFVKALGDYTTSLQAIEPGALARIEGPHGRLFARAPHDAGARQLFIAGGIGITPFLGLLRAEAPTNIRADVHYYAKSAEAALFREELRALEHRHPALRVFTHVEEEEGLPSLAAIERVSGPASTWGGIVLCGPPAMQRLLRRQMKRAGVPRRRLRTEEFQFI
jgi:predicted ferric reductase